MKIIAEIEVQHYGYDSKIEFEDEDKKNEVLEYEGTQVIIKIMKLKSDLMVNTY
jgi:hypothetical protein